MPRYALLLLLCFVQGCAASNVSPNVVRETWVLRQLDGRRIGHSSPEAATVRFLANHFIAGTEVCNDVGGEELTWSTDASGEEGTFDLDRSAATITTAVGCLNEEATQIGDRFWALMSDARGWSVEGRRLTISFSDGNTAVLVPIQQAGS